MESNISNEVLNEESPSVSYDVLCSNTIERCEFCDKVFYNKYDSIVHTAKHIIIPLIKQKIHQCTICLYVFNSPIDLSIHFTEKHLMTLIAFEKSSTDEKMMIDDDIMMNDDDIMINDDDISIISLSSDDESPVKDNAMCNINNQINNECSIGDETEMIESGEMMESDEMKHGDVGVISPLVLENDVYNDNKPDYGPSVHYDDLVVPKLTSCQHCGKLFQNRYNAIIHEASHMRRKIMEYRLCIICERYIQGNTEGLKRHFGLHHPLEKFKGHNMSALRSCNQCGMRYKNYPAHVKNYHRKTNLCALLLNPDEEMMKDDKRLQLIPGAAEKIISAIKMMKCVPEVAGNSLNTPAKMMKDDVKMINGDKSDSKYDNFIFELHDVTEKKYVSAEVMKNGGTLVKMINGVKSDHIIKYDDKEHDITTNKCRTSAEMTKNYRTQMMSVPPQSSEMMKNDGVHTKMMNDDDRSVEYVNLCTVCSLFLRNKSFIKYKFIKNINELGSRQLCISCNKLYFEVKQYIRIRDFKLNTIKHRYTILKPVKVNDKNKERLKNIKFRIKMLNK